MSVKYELEGDVAVITLNRPDRFNAIEPLMVADVIESLRKATAESRALVLTGEGKAFCAGADLSVLEGDGDSPPDLAQFLDDVFHPMVHAFTSVEVPTIAAVNGVAAGAGLGLALGCDIRVMAASAFLTSAFTAIGLAPDSGTTTWLLPRQALALGLCWRLESNRVEHDQQTGQCRRGDPSSLALGLCAEVAPDDQVVESAMRLAATLADMVPDSLVTTSLTEIYLAEKDEFRASVGRRFAELLARVHTLDWEKQGFESFMEISSDTSNSLRYQRALARSPSGFTTPLCNICTKKENRPSGAATASGPCVSPNPGTTHSPLI